MDLYGWVAQTCQNFSFSQFYAFLHVNEGLELFLTNHQGHRHCSFLPHFIHFENPIFCDIKWLKVEKELEVVGLHQRIKLELIDWQCLFQRLVLVVFINYVVIRWSILQHHIHPCVFVKYPHHPIGQQIPNRLFREEALPNIHERYIIITLAGRFFERTFGVVFWIVGTSILWLFTINWWIYLCGRLEVYIMEIETPGLSFIEFKRRDS